MSFLLIVKLALVLSVVLTVLAMALRAKALDALYLVHNPSVGIRTIVSMFIIVPVVAVLMATAFDLDPPVKVALVALALSPMPPLLPNRQVKLGGHADYISGVLFGSAVASLVMAPLGVWIIDQMYPGNISLPAGKIVMPLLLTVGVPLLIGQLLRARLSIEQADKLAGVCKKVGTVLLVVCVLILLVLLGRTILSLVNLRTLFPMAVMILAGLVAGFILAGDRAAQPVLALASATRHPGAAIAIATATVPDERLAPAAILVFVVLNALIAAPLLRQIMKVEDKVVASTPAT